MYPLLTTTNEVDLAYECDSMSGYSVHGVQHNINMELNELII